MGHINFREVYDFLIQNLVSRVDHEVLFILMLENTQIFVGQAILSYKPPFTITNNILKLCQSIGKELGFLEGTKILTPSVQLRKDNQIKTIYSSSSLPLKVITLAKSLLHKFLKAKE